MYKILIPQDISSIAKQYLQDRGYKIQIGPKFDIDTLKQEVVDADALIVRTAEYPKEVIDCGKKLKIIARHGVGVDNIDLTAAKEKGIWVTVAKNANSISVAEHTICLIFAAAKNLLAADIACRNGKFALRNKIGGMELKGKTLGVIGFGAIGREVGKIASSGLGMHILAYDVFKPTEVNYDYTFTEDLNEIYKKADVITLHTPLVKETKNMINNETIGLMKDGVIIVNCARGGIINEDDLYENLKSGKVCAAGLDVFTNEPIESENKLFELNNVVLTPHIAALTKEAGEAMAMSCAMAVDDVLSGKQPKYPIVTP